MARVCLFVRVSRSRAQSLGREGGNLFGLSRDVGKDGDGDGCALGVGIR